MPVAISERTWNDLIEGYKLLYFSAQRFFTAETNLARLIDFQHLDHDFIAFLQYIRHLGDSFLGNLRDMQQAFRSGQNFDKRAEIDDFLHGAAVNLSDFRFFGQPFHHRDGAGGRFGIAGSNGYGAVIFHINGHTGFADNLTDILAAGTNDCANLIFLHFDRRNARRVK